MRHIHAQIVLKAKDDPALGWTYSHWILDFGNGEEPLREDVRIKCAETSRRYMSRQEAEAEARHRIMFRINQLRGQVPDPRTPRDVPHLPACRRWTSLRASLSS